MKYPKEIFVKDYFEVHDYYSKIYGKNKTIILMQVGSFHECYCVDKKKGLNLIKLAAELDVSCPLKNGKKQISESNPRMLGFPIYVVNNFIEKLCNLNFTVVLIDQVTKPPKPKREVTGIYSPATLIPSNNTYSVSKSTFLTSIVIDFNKKNNISLFVIGLTSYDLTTGYGYFYESYSKPDDIMLALDESLRFLEAYPTREIIIYFNEKLDRKINDLSYQDILSYLNISNKNIFKMNKIKNLKKLSYQKEILEKVFESDQFDIVDNLGLSFLNWARLSLTMLLQYTQDHQKSLLNKLKKPEGFVNENILFLGNRALDQLDILPNTNKPTSLFDIINYTKSCLGKRFLRDSLAKPLINQSKIKERQDIIKLILKEKINTELGDMISDIYDLEKLNRKMEMESMHPYELYHFYYSFRQIIDIVDYLPDKIKNKLNYNSKQLNCISEMINYVEETFDLDKMINLNFTNYKETDSSFFNEKVSDKIDKLQNKIITSKNIMNELVKVLEKFIDDKNYFASKNKLINIKYRERDGHYLILTTRRFKLMNKKLSKIKKLDIGGFKINVSDLDITEMPKSSNTKINCKKIKEISSNLVVYQTELASLLQQEFNKQCSFISNKFSDPYNYWTKQMAKLDFLNSGAIGSKKLGYCCPDIIDDEYSYFKTVELRHPIVEVINQDVEYHPHTLELGTDLKGILLYGINSSGKSTLMKSIGINIILAQIGYFVSAKSFELSPYKSLFTRINGNDNIFRGLSSFMVEMVELMAILKRNNEHTLVIGDEICRGTEEKSANILVAYMLEKLSKNQTSFITATHLHQIAEMPSVKKLENVKAKHLKVEYDLENDILVYSRDLQDGQGEKFYGVQVAKFVMKDKLFNQRTLELEKEYQGEIKTSNYNSNNWMVECYFCKSAEKLETHHINWQKDCEENRVKNKPHINKNSNYNLLTVCQECHDKIDTGEIEVDGYMLTSKGKKLKFKKSKKKSKHKFNNEEITIIMKYNNLTLKQAKKEIKKELNVKISTSTINKIWNNNYV